MSIPPSAPSYLSAQPSIHYLLFRADADYILKIADFGLSRDLYEKEYYKLDDMNKALPIKWMAIECIKEGKFTVKSDVVSNYYQLPV